jgi:hypothetical protein
MGTDDHHIRRTTLADMKLSMVAIISYRASLAPLAKFLSADTSNAHANTFS